MLSRSTLLASLVAADLCALATARANPSSCAAPIDPTRFSAGGIQVVTGFLGQRLYLHAQHPDACANGAGDGCKASAYVVSGDKVFVGDMCGAWTAVKFPGKGRDYYGWVQADRLANVSDAIHPESTAGTAVHPPVPLWCSSLRDYYEGTREGRHPAAPFREITEQHDPLDVPADFMPAHGGDNSDVELTELNVDGHSVKLADVIEPGMCGARYLEIWSSDLRRYLGDAPHDSSPVEIGAKTYLSSGENYGRIEVIGFHSDLTPFPACAITLQPLRPERVSFAADAGLCDAVRLGKVEDVGLEEITPTSVDGAAFGSISSKIEGAIVFEFLRRGSVDIDNDGQAELVAMARSSGPPRGCGTRDYIWEWPVVLNQRGLPDVQANLNKEAVRAGNEMARLIRYQGRIYVESRSLADGLPASHSVSEVSSHGLKKMCEFNPLHYTVESGAP